VVQYGVGTFFARNLFILLDFLYKAVGDWGLAIILLVVIVRIILFPLTFKGMVSMYKLKELAPKMKEIQQKYKKDPQKLQMHMMKLYKEHGANPLGGCLPLLLQIPIFYGIYKLLLYSIELKGAEFLWIHDLSEMDPYFILPILMGLTMYLHQKLTPTNFQDPMQEKIFKFLPLIFTFMMATFPAGLVLYWTINNILSILQQYIINKLMERRSENRS
jgi:YidC/Oxa1 family membrane protein insertase